MRKFLSLVLALVMALSLCAPAWGAEAEASTWDGVVPDEMPATLVVDDDTQTVHVKDAAAFAYLSTLSAKWAEFYTDGNGREYGNYHNGAGANYYYSGDWTVSLEANIDLANYPIEPVVIMFGEATGATAFNGNDHVISNINTTTGLFATRTRASFSDFTLLNVKATSGALTDFAEFPVTNVTVKNATISGTDYVGGLVGKTYSSVTGCKVIDSSVVATGKEAGGLIGYAEANSKGSTIANNTVENVTVFANNRAAGLVAQANNDVKVFNNTVDSVTVGAEDESKYKADYVVSNAIVPENVYDNNVIIPPVLIGSTKYDTLQDAVEAVKDGETITVNVADESAVVGAVKSFTVVGEAVTITAADGYDVAVADGKYVVTVAKAEIKDEEIKTDVAVVAPEVKVEVETDDPVENEVVNTLNNAEKPVEFDEQANEALEAVIPEVTVSAEDAAEALVGAQIPVVSGDTVNVVVQPYFDVTVEEVNVVTDATTGTVASASIKLDISPMYQTVVTTADTAAEIALDGADKNAVVVDKQPVTETITKPVTIKIAIPAALAMDDGNGGFKPLYVTHEKDLTGVKYVYEAKVEGNDVDGYTATFVNPNGFSTFTLSTENNTVAVVGDMNYATLQGAIDNAGKGAVIEVMVNGLEADITAPFSFKLKLAEGVDEPTFNVAEGYTMSKWYVNGVYTYIVQSASAGGYAPVAPSTPEKVVTSAKTFDAGIALYVGMSVMAAAGSVVVLKKRED